MGDHPQSIVNKQVASRADILVALFGAKLGSPTEKHTSGTVEEIEEALAADKPVLLYFSAGDIKRDAFNAEQYAKLQEFKEDCEKRGLYAEFDSPDTLQTKLLDHLVFLANDSLQGFDASIASVNLVHAVEAELSDHAKSILKTAASGDGDIVFAPHMVGVSIRVGSYVPPHPESPRDRAKWEGAIEELEDEGYLVGIDADKIFRVTQKGYDFSDTLGEEWLMNK